ncbi:hypothetical protein ACP4OV_011870 [Aristida adscensionis]
MRWSLARSREMEAEEDDAAAGLGSRRARESLLLAWVLLWLGVSSRILLLMSSQQAVDKRREALATMCDHRARLLQDHFNASMNHLQALAITVSTFHHSKKPSAIDQMTFARYAGMTAFQSPLTTGVAYAVQVTHAEREKFERQQGWSIKKMYFSNSMNQSWGSMDAEVREPAEEYAPVIFAQDAYKHAISIDMLSGNEDRENILRARQYGKGVLTAPFRLLNNHTGVVLTYTVYRSELPPNARPQERIQAAIGYIGGIFDMEAVVHKLHHKLVGMQPIIVNVYDTTNESPISMYGSNDTRSGMLHICPLNFGDPSRRHEMRCRFMQEPQWSWEAVTTSFGTFVIALLIGYIYHATLKRIAKAEDEFREMMELNKRTEAADAAKSKFMDTVSQEVRTPMNDVLGDRSIPFLVPKQAKNLSILSVRRMDSMQKELSALERMVERSEKPSNLSLSVLKYITNDFSEERKIGKGGCGEVYKGVLPNGIIVAVKKLFNKHTIDEKQFNQEFQSMVMAEHHNIVRFIGYCSHTEQKAMRIEGKFVMADMRERLLCFEYISKGSLDNYLTDELRGLEWHTRYKIIKGVCEGLQHLHKEKRIIHMDLKPANILLDVHMVPKIADFGISRLAEISHTLSNDRLCTPQYCAPEYKHHGKMSLKTDIYSLGVIILELVTGSKEEPSIVNVLRRWCHRWNKSSKHLLEYKQVTKCLELALRCMHKDPSERPFIWNIVDELHQIENTNSNDDTVDQISSCLEDMLGIEPVELHFPFKPNKNISCSLQLTNYTDDYFAFRIETMKPLQYCIQPIKDVVPPRSKCNVTVMTQTRKQAPKHEYCKEEFTVQSTRVDGALTAMGITEDLFCEKKTGKVVDNVNLSVVFDTPPFPEEPKKDLSATPRILLDEVINQEAGNSSDESQLTAPKEGTSAQVVFLLNLWLALRRLLECHLVEKLRFHWNRGNGVPRGSQSQKPEYPDYPMSEACSRMDLPTIHQTLEARGYQDDYELDGTKELSFQMWTEQGRCMLDARKLGDAAFCSRRFKAAIEHYTESVDLMPTAASPTVYARQSFCHLMCGDPRAALNDAVTAQRLHPDWATPVYLQAIALSKLDMQGDAMDMYNEAVLLEERRVNK